MKRENDEITDLFRSRLGNAEMTVRDGFWEELDRTVVTGDHRRHRLIFFRVAAAASVLLVLVASSAAIWYFSPKEEVGEAFTQIAAVSGSGVMDGDGVQHNLLPIPVEPILQKPAPRLSGMLAHYLGEEDSISITLSMSFSFSSTFGRRAQENTNRRESLWKIGENAEQMTSSEETPVATQSAKVKKPRTWAVKAFAGTALPADEGTYKMPVSAGVTVEKKLNRYLAVESGLLYSNLRSEGQHLQYLGIPVKLNFTFVETPKLDLYATIGGIADKCIAGAPNNDFKNEPIQLAVTAGVGINYKINDRIALFVEPGVSRHFKTDSKLATVRTERSANFNLLCGIRMMY